MYRLEPLKVYALDEVRADQRWMQRMERMLAAIGRRLDDVSWFAVDEVPSIVGELKSLWPPEQAPSDLPITFLRPLVFTLQRLDGAPFDPAPLLQQCPEGTTAADVKHLLGYIDTVRAYHRREEDWEKDWVCWPTHDFGVMAGCPHGCHYCGEGKWGKYITVCLNLEDYMEQVVGPTIERFSWQKCFRMIGWGADIIAFEPEYGCFDLYTRKLAEYEEHYGYFHTTSANVEWMADLPHRDRLIGVWSTTGDKVARLIEPGAGPAVERIRAARKCQEMGIPVRFKFKPIIPVRGWREDYAAILRQALTLTRPESIGLCVIMWMDIDRLAKMIDLSLLDEEYVAEAQRLADEMKGCATGPFPPHVRAEIYRFFISVIRDFDSNVPVYLSTEQREMWDELQDELGQDPRAYVCGCSSVCLPGPRLDLSADCPCSTYLPPSEVHKPS